MRIDILDVCFNELLQASDNAKLSWTMFCKYWDKLVRIEDIALENLG
jgi:hypothetical protein